VSCPTDNDYALLLDGQFGPDEREALEQHIDQCADCRALVAALGSAYAPSQSEPLSRPPSNPRSSNVALARHTPEDDARSAPERSASESRRQLLALELVMLSVHLVWSALFLPHLLRAVFWRGNPGQWAEHSFQPSLGGLGFIALVFAMYCAVWAPLGAAWASASAYGFWRHRPWARAAAKIHVWVSLPSGFLVPLGLLTLRELGRTAAAPDPRGRGRAPSDE
jgi:anti-sigma factor RsiW